MIIDNVNYITGIIKYILRIDYIVAVNQQRIILGETKIFERLMAYKK